MIAIQVLLNISSEAAPAHSPMREHGVAKRPRNVSREAAAETEQRGSLSPLRGFGFLRHAIPWAYAQGYVLPPHSRLENDDPPCFKEH